MPHSCNILRSGSVFEAGSEQPKAAEIYSNVEEEYKVLKRIAQLGNEAAGSLYSSLPTPGPSEDSKNRLAIVWGPPRLCR